MAVSYVFNPFTGNFDAVDTVTLAPVGSSPNANAGTISGDNTLTLEPANTSFPGVLLAADWNTFNNAATLVTTPRNPNLVFAGPASGSAASPTFRTLVSADIPDLSAFYVTQSEVGQPNGVASLDGSGKVPGSQLPSTLLEYQGLWNPATNTPTLQDSTGINAYVYQVSMAFPGPIVGLNSPTMVNFQVGNLVIYSTAAGEWQQADSLTGVTSVNGSTGAVTVNAINQLTGDITAGPATQSQSKIATLTATTNGTLTTLSALSLPGAQVTGNIAGNAANITATSNSTLTSLPSLSLPATQLSGTLQAAQFPALTGDVTTTAGSLATHIAATSNATLTTLSGLTTASSLASVGTITTGTWDATPVTVPYGGTGQTSLIGHYVLVGNGTSGITSVNPLTAGLVLTSNGASIDPSFQPAPGSTPTFQVLTSGTSYLTPTNAKLLKITVVGAGGGGGGAATTSGQAAAGGGGGGGGTAIAWISNPTSTYTYAIGAGNSGGTGNAAGTAGGSSTFNTTIIGGGGGGGGGSFASAVAAVPLAVGGTSGSASGGSVNMAGGNGHVGIAFGTNGFVAGAGGSSIFGVGNANGANGSAHGPGSVGNNYGAGGSGAGNAGTQATAGVGGAGGPGIIIVEEFY